MTTTKQQKQCETLRQSIGRIKAKIDLVQANGCEARNRVLAFELSQEIISLSHSAGLELASRIKTSE